MKKIQYVFACLLLVISVSCSQDFESDAYGYLTLDINTLVSTHRPGTRTDAPADYVAKQLYVEIVNAQGKLVKSTNDFHNDNAFAGTIALMPGTYTVNAHSYGWDGSGSGLDVPYYSGTTTATIVKGTAVRANLTCTQANVKVTVNFEPSFTTNFTSATSIISSALAGVSSLTFRMGQTLKPGYFPVADLEAGLTVVNKKGETYTATTPITGVKAREHYILNYKVAESGNLGDGTTGGVNVTVDESTNTYTYTFEVPTKSGNTIVAKNANAWSNFAMLSGDITSKTSSFQTSGIKMQWRAVGQEQWNDMENSNLAIGEDDKIQCTLKGLAPNTKYEYQFVYVEGDNETPSNVVSFTTEKQTELYNGGFDSWTKIGAAWYANESGLSYWDSSNPGSTSLGESYNVTTNTDGPLHGGSGAARLESKYIVIKFAAASLYTGKFKELVGTKGAKLDWGVEFTSRPTALKGWMQYAPKAIDRAGSGLPSGAPAKGDMDQCGMFIVLLSESIAIDNTDLSTIPNWDTDSRVIAYGALPQNQNVDSNGQWKEVNIPLVYRNLTSRPSYLLVVFSSSKYGDYFHGGTGSTLYLDDFSLEYGDSPILK